MDIYENKDLATIKKQNDSTEFVSKEEYEQRIKELARCKRDIVYFAEKYFRVINLDKGLHVIKLYDVQKELLQFMVNNNKIIVCSGRQQGKSTIYCIYSLWYSCFYPEKKIMILANKAATALELLGRIETAYTYLPKWLKPAVVTFNKGQMLFSNKSEVRAFASSSDAARGFSANCVDPNTKITIRFKNKLFKRFKFTVPIWVLRFFSKKRVNNNISNEPPVKIYVNE